MKYAEIAKDFFAYKVKWTNKVNKTLDGANSFSTHGHPDKYVYFWLRSNKTDIVNFYKRSIT